MSAHKNDGGEKLQDSIQSQQDAKGAYDRVPSGFRNWVTEEGGEFPAEADRYHLYISLACPWANRCQVVRNMKGLEDVIGLSIVHPTWQYTRPGQDEHAGWTFASPEDPPFSNLLGHGEFDAEFCIPDTINNAKSVRDLYEMSGDTIKKFTVPVLWDKKNKCIVNNESSEIVVMLNKAFNKFAKNPSLDLYPAHLEQEIADLDSWIYNNINNGVYRCGFATKQGAYDEAYKTLMENLDKAEALLGKQRYLCGDTLTLMDLKLYMTLIRFDPVYVVYFKTYNKRIDEYPNLWNFTKEIYQIPEVRAATNFKHIKTHYFTSHPKLNTYAIIPNRPNPAVDEPHDRDAKFPLKTVASKS